MAGGFLCGLMAVGLALLAPEEGRRPVPAPDPFSPRASQRASAVLPHPEPQKDAPRLAIVVNNLGYDPSGDASWLSFPEKITVAVIPFGPSSRRIAESARARGFGIMLHVPMEPEGEAPDRTEGFRLRRDMDGGTVRDLLNRMAESLPEATGASSHMGSAFTADPDAMMLYASLLKERGLFLMDSVTTPRSVAVEAARRAGVPAIRRDVFFDPAAGPDATRRQWERALALARERGAAVLVCHPRAETLSALLKLRPDLQAEGIRAVTVDDLLKAE
jgi:uncharacterized protein